MLEREYLQESLSYVLGIQEVQERIKFEFVEIILSKYINRPVFDKCTLIRPFLQDSFPTGWCFTISAMK